MRRNKLFRGIAIACMVLFCVTLAGCAASNFAELLGSGITQPSEMSQEEKEMRIKQDYINWMGGSHCACSAEDVDVIIISQVDSGTAMFVGCKCSSFDSSAPFQDLFGSSAADLLFYVPNGWYIMFYKDSDFLYLDAAYNNRWLTYPELRTIWDEYHAQHPEALEVWKNIFPGLSEPPERDPSGLDYEVNGDGKTCTITDMGVCREVDLVIPEYVGGYQVTAIGEEAFMFENFASVVMPDSVVSIGKSAFERCHELRSVKLSSNLETIGSNAFSGCKSLEDIVIPESVTTMEVGAFYDCESIKQIVIPDGVTKIATCTFYRCNNLASVTIPDSVTSIGGSAFFGCDSLTEVVIPEGLTYLGEGAFNGCKNLKKVNIPDGVTTIENATFVGCVSLESIRIPEGVTSIGWSAFERCASLKKIVIPDNVTILDRQAFADCTGLVDLYIGKGVGEIDFTTFQNCSNLTTLTVSTENTVYHSESGCLIKTAEKRLVRAALNAVVPGDGSVLHIGQRAFCGLTELRQITLPEGIESIAANAFADCEELEYIYLPVSLKSLSIAFDGCKALEVIHYGGTEEQWYSIRKGSTLADAIQSFTIRCTDGDLKVR